MTEWSFRLERRSPRDRALIYEEPGHRLEMALEVSGARGADLVGDDTLPPWTEPAGMPVGATKRDEILERLQTWAAQRRLRILLSPSQTLVEHFAEMKAKGWKEETQPDGSVHWRPPKRSSSGRMKILWDVFRNVIGK